MIPGRIADKLGNRYEAKWLVLKLIGLVLGQAPMLRFEGADQTSYCLPVAPTSTPILVARRLLDMRRRFRGWYPGGRNELATPKPTQLVGAVERVLWLAEAAVKDASWRKPGR